MQAWGSPGPWGAWTPPGGPRPRPPPGTWDPSWGYGEGYNLQQPPPYEAYPSAEQQETDAPPGTTDDAYGDEPPPPGQENVPVFTPNLAKPPPMGRASGPIPQTVAVPPMLAEVDVTKPPPPFIPTNRARAAGTEKSPPAVRVSPWGRGGDSTPVSPWDAVKGGVSLDSIPQEVSEIVEVPVSSGPPGVELDDGPPGMGLAPPGMERAPPPGFGPRRPPEREERVEPLGLSVRIYVLNGDQPLCKGVEVRHCGTSGKHVLRQENALCAVSCDWCCSKHKPNFHESFTRETRMIFSIRIFCC